MFTQYFVPTLFLAIADQTFFLFFIDTYPQLRETSKGVDMPFIVGAISLYALYGYIIYKYIVQKTLNSTLVNVIVFVWLIYGTFNLCNYYLFYDIWQPRIMIKDVVWGMILFSTTSMLSFCMKK